MKRNRKTDLEEMRYRVPGIRNRFFHVNSKIIAVCLVLCFVAIMFTFAFESVKEKTQNKAHPKIFYFIRLDAPEGTLRSFALSNYFFDNCFVYYDERCIDKDDEDAFNFTWCEQKIYNIIVYEHALSHNKNMIIIFSSNGSNYSVYTEKDIELLKKESFSKEEVMDIILEIRS